MAGTIRGSIEHYFVGTSMGTGSVQSFFVNCYNFFNDNTASLGLQRIAYNTGSQATGMAKFRGMNYFDQPNPCGNGSFAVFRFLSASIPFDLLIQYTGDVAINNAPGNPALADGANNTYYFCFSIAQNVSGTSVWNGTLLNDGNDKKGTPVWTDTNNTFYIPRSNDSIRTGATRTNKENLTGFSVAQNTTYRQHIIADYDSFVILYDTAADNSYTALGFSNYSPTTNLNSAVPYFGFCENSSLPINAGGTYGTVAGSGRNGGIAYPELWISGTCTLSFDRISTTFFQSVTSQPNKTWKVQRFDEFPMFIGCFESPNQLGLVGQHSSFFREAYNIATHDTNGDGTRAVFGTTTLAEVKLTVPWHSGTTPGTGITRSGVQFGI